MFLFTKEAFFSLQFWSETIVLGQTNQSCIHYQGMKKSISKTNIFTGKIRESTHSFGRFDANLVKDQCFVDLEGSVKMLYNVQE